MSDQETMQTRCLGGFSVLWVTKRLISPVKIRIFCPKTTKKIGIFIHIGPGLTGSFGALLVGSCGARAASRKTPIYFIIIKTISLTAFPPLSVIHSDNISVTTCIMPAHCSCVLIPDNVIIVLDINASELSVFSGHVKLSELHIF